MMSGDPRQFGRQAEELAKTYLMDMGLEFIDSNFHSRYGEIDLIMKEDDILVFVEIKFRGEKSYGNIVESINRAKQRKIVQTSRIYLQKNKIADRMLCRFDVVFISGRESGGINWIKDAFRIS